MAAATTATTAVKTAEQNGVHRATTVTEKPYVVLVALCDGKFKEFPLLKRQMMKCEVLKKFVADCEKSPTASDNIAKWIRDLGLVDVDGSMSHVIRFLDIIEKYPPHGIEFPIVSPEINGCTSQQIYALFAEPIKNPLCWTAMLLAATQLGIPSLRDLAIAAIAGEIKNRSTAQHTVALGVQTPPPPYNFVPLIVDETKKNPKPRPQQPSAVPTPATATETASTAPASPPQPAAGTTVVQESTSKMEKDSN